MRDMPRAALLRRAKRTDHGHLNPHVDMSPVSYQVLQIAITQTTEIESTRHPYHTGLLLSHSVHRHAIHLQRLQKEHVRKMDAGPDQNRRAFQL